MVIQKNNDFSSKPEPWIYWNFPFWVFDLTLSSVYVHTRFHHCNVLPHPGCSRFHWTENLKYCNIFKTMKGLLACYKRSINIYMILVSRIHSAFSWCQIYSFCITSRFGESKELWKISSFSFPRLPYNLFFKW